MQFTQIHQKYIKYIVMETVWLKVKPFPMWPDKAVTKLNAFLMSYPSLHECARENKTQNLCSVIHLKGVSYPKMRRLCEQPLFPPTTF